MVSKRSSAAKSLGLAILFDFRQVLVIQINCGFSFRSELLRSLCILKPLGWLLRVGSVQPACSCCAPESVRTARQIPQCRSVVRSSRFSAGNLRPAQATAFLYPLFPVRPASIKALVRTTAIWGLSYTNLNHAGLIGGQDSSASKSTLNSASKNSIVAGWLSSDASRVDSSAHSNRRSRVNGKMILPKSVCLKSPQVFRVLPNEISLRSSRTYELCHLGLQPTFARNGTSSKEGCQPSFAQRRIMLFYETFHDQPQIANSQYFCHCRSL